MWPGREGKNNKAQAAWSNKKELLDKRRDKKLRIAEKRTRQEEGKEVEEKLEKLEDEVDDDLEADYKMMKKLKKGQISQDTFDKAFAIDSVESELC